MSGELRGVGHAMTIAFQDKEVDDEDLSIKTVYATMWKICKLKRTYITASCDPLH